VNGTGRGVPGVLRTIACVVCFALGGLLVPAAVTAGWARATLLDTDGFVNAYGGLAEDPAVQDAVATQAIAAIEPAVDGLAGQAAGAIASGLPGAAGSAVQDLVGSAQLALHALIEREVRGFVASDAFADVWRGLLRTGHAGLVQILEGGTGSSFLGVDETGTVSVQLQPLLAAMRDRLVAAGVTIASQLPDTQARIELGRIPVLPLVAAGVRDLVLLSVLLPCLAVLLLAAAVLLARRRRRGLVTAAAVVLAAAALPALALLLAWDAVVSAVSTSAVPPAAVAALAGAALGPLQIALLVLAGAALIWLVLTLLLPRRRRARRPVAP